MYSIQRICGVLGSFFLSICFLHAQKTYQTSTILMGSAFVFSASHESEDLAWKAIEAAKTEVQRVERLISSWDPHSQTSEINRQAGVQPVKVSYELFSLVRRALKVAKLTKGAFDPSFAAIDRVWVFDGSMTELPSEEAIMASISKIDYRKVRLDERDTTIYLEAKGMKIGFGAIGKGYAANRAKHVMQDLGIQHGLVNAGGDLICWGKKDARLDWRVGIADPAKAGEVLGWMSINDMAVVTSGDYERFATIAGVRYPHIIDPRTGYPAQGLQSVTIVCPDAEVADALATAVFVLGEKKGLELINQLKGIEAILLTDQGDVHATDRISLFQETSDVPVELNIGNQ